MAGDSFALSDAGVAGFENENNNEGGVFYGAGCALFQDLFYGLASLDAPPTPPPPPIVPLTTANELSPIRIFFSMGMSPAMARELGPDTTRRSTDFDATPYRQRRKRNLQSQNAYDEAAEIIDSSTDPNVIRACTQHTPGEDTLCETAGYENAVRIWARALLTQTTTGPAGTHPFTRFAFLCLAVGDVRFRRDAHVPRAPAGTLQVWRAAAHAAVAVAAHHAAALSLAAALAAAHAAAADDTAVAAATVSTAALRAAHRRRVVLP